MLASTTEPFIKDLHVNPLGVTMVFHLDNTDPSPSRIFQEENAKLRILCPNLLGNVDPSSFPSESETLRKCWLVSVVTCSANRKNNSVNC